MPENTEIIDRVFRTIVKVISRRTTRVDAMKALNTAVDNIKSNYDFLNYVKIDSIAYSEDMGSIKIDQEINTIEIDKIRLAVESVIEELTKGLSKDPNYFFITEVKDELESEFQALGDSFGLDLHRKQFEYTVGKKATEQIKTFAITNTDILKTTFAALNSLISKKTNESEAIQTLNNSLNKLKEKYEVLHLVNINDNQEVGGKYSIDIQPDINNIESKKVGEALQSFITEIASSPNIQTRQTFVKDFKTLLGNEHLSWIESMGVNLAEVDKIILQQSHGDLVRKTFEAIMEIVDTKTSEGSAIQLLHAILIKLTPKHDILKHITIDESRMHEGINSLNINPEINNYESYTLGKAIEEIMKITMEQLVDSTFIDSFKEKIGEDYVKDIEKIGVKLHFLEMRF